MNFIKKNLLSLIMIFASIFISWGAFTVKFSDLEARVYKTEEKVADIEDVTATELRTVNQNLTEIKTKLDLLFEGKININK